MYACVCPLSQIQLADSAVDSRVCKSFTFTKLPLLTVSLQEVLLFHPHNCWAFVCARMHLLIMCVSSASSKPFLYFPSPKSRVQCTTILPLPFIPFSLFLISRFDVNHLLIEKWIQSIVWKNKKTTSKQNTVLFFFFFFSTLFSFFLFLPSFSFLVLPLVIAWNDPVLWEQEESYWRKSLSHPDEECGQCLLSGWDWGEEGYRDLLINYTLSARSRNSNIVGFHFFADAKNVSTHWQVTMRKWVKIM